MVTLGNIVSHAAGSNPAPPVFFARRAYIVYCMRHAKRDQRERNEMRMNTWSIASKINRAYLVSVFVSFVEMEGLEQEYRRLYGSKARLIREWRSASLHAARRAVEQQVDPATHVVYPLATVDNKGYEAQTQKLQQRIFAVHEAMKHECNGSSPSQR